MGRVVILGVFVADTAYRAARAPKMGETIMGESFALGPGGKGSNQAVAAAMAGAETHMITRLARDPFGDMALATWAKAGVVPEVKIDAESYTGAAYIFDLPSVEEPPPPPPVCTAATCLSALAWFPRFVTIVLRYC